MDLGIRGKSALVSRLAKDWEKDVHWRWRARG